MPYLTDEEYKNLYSKEDVDKIIKYSCEYQKATCYQEVARILWPEGHDLTDIEVKVLDYLADDNICINEITIKDCLEDETQ